MRFLIFFLEDETSAPDVFSSCSFIPRAHFETSQVMVRYYDYEIWRHTQVIKQFLSENDGFFKLFSTVKITCGWNGWYKVRIYVLLYMSSTKNNHLSRFYVTCFLILGKIQDGGQDSGGSAWITSNVLVRPPQPKRLDSSILFSLVKLVISSASIHLSINRLS